MAAIGPILIDGKPLEDLKVVELRKELEQRNLPKSGNKKELADRLRNYLLKSGEATAFMSSPISDQHQTQSDQAIDMPAKHATTMSPLVKQYLANQQQALAEAKMNADFIRGTSDSEGIEAPSDTRGEEETGGQTTIPEEDIQQQPTPPALLAAVIQQQPAAASQVDGAAQHEGTEQHAPETEKTSAVEQPAHAVANTEEVSRTKPEARAQREEPPMAVGEELDFGTGSDEELGNDAEEEPEEEENQGPEATGQISTQNADTKEDIERKEEDATKEIDHTDDNHRVDGHPGVSHATSSEMGTTGRKIDEKPALEGSSKQQSEPPPSMTPLSPYICIQGLKRPFTQKQLLAMLSSYGELDMDSFWMDQIKSTCIAKFDNEEQAKKARDSLHNTVWPSASDSSLKVEYSNKEQLAQRRGENEKKAVPPSLNPPLNSLLMGLIPSRIGLTVTVDNRIPTLGREVDMFHNRIDMRDGVIQAVDDDRLPEPIAEKRRREESPESSVEAMRPTLDGKDLEQLFRKTVALPALYYLPLTEEEAEVRAERKRQATLESGNNRDRQEADRRGRRANYDERGPRGGSMSGTTGGSIRRSRSPMEKRRQPFNQSPPRRRR